MAEELMTIPLSNLRRSAGNIRKTDATRDLEELAASIVAHGLLQNLTVRPVSGNGKKRATAFEVVAGGRRLAALKLLAKRKRIAKGFPKRFVRPRYGWPTAPNIGLGEHNNSLPTGAFDGPGFFFSGVAAR